MSTDSQNKRAQAYETALEALVKILRKHPKGLAARELAKQLDCSKPTVYARVEALEARGFKFQRPETRAGERGPLARAFVLKAEPA